MARQLHQKEVVPKSMKMNSFERQTPVSGLTGHSEAAGDSDRSFSESRGMLVTVSVEVR